MATPHFDLRQLFSVIDTERQRQSLTWAALSRQIGVSPSTIRRFNQASDAEADGALAAIRWLDAIPESYLTGDKGVGAALPASGDGYVRVDMDAVAAALGDNRAAQAVAPEQLSKTSWLPPTLRNSPSPHSPASARSS